MAKYVCLIGASILSFCGCRSVQVSDYTLSPAQTMSNEAHERVLGLQIVVTRIPLQEDRRELVVRTGNEELQFLDNEQWASPLGNEIRDAVQLELGRQLANADPMLVATLRKVELKIDVQLLEAVMGQYVSMAATWTTQINGAVIPLQISCRFQTNEAAFNGIKGVVRGYQLVVIDLARDIAASLTASYREQRIACSPVNRLPG